MFSNLPLKDSKLSGSDILLFGPAESRNVFRARMTQFTEPEPEDHEFCPGSEPGHLAGADTFSKDSEGRALPTAQGGGFQPLQPRSSVDAPSGFSCEIFKNKQTTFQDLNSKVGIIITPGWTRVGRQGTVHGLGPSKSPFREG